MAKAYRHPDTGPDREESLAREVFAQLVGHHDWRGKSLDHLAGLAVEAAWAFYEAWDRHGQEKANTS